MQPQLLLGITTQGRGTYQLHKYTHSGLIGQHLLQVNKKGVQNLTSIAKDTQMHSWSIYFKLTFNLLKIYANEKITRFLWLVLIFQTFKQHLPTHLSTISLSILSGENFKNNVNESVPEKFN